MPFAITSEPELRHTGNASTEVAIRIARSGLLTIDAYAPTFNTLVSIATKNGRDLTLSDKSSVSGYAADALAGIAHVNGALHLGCKGPDSHKQHVIIQEQLTSKPFTFTNTSCNKANVINLMELLHTFGIAYDSVYFDEQVPDDHHKLIAAVRQLPYAATACILVYAVVLRGYWVQKHALKRD